MHKCKPCPFCSKKELAFEKGYPRKDADFPPAITCLVCNVTLSLNDEEGSLEDLVGIWNNQD